MTNEENAVRFREVSGKPGGKLRHIQGGKNTLKEESLCSVASWHRLEIRDNPQRQIIFLPLTLLLLRRQRDVKCSVHPDIEAARVSVLYKKSSCSLDEAAKSKHKNMCGGKTQRRTEDTFRAKIFLE